MQVGFLAAAPFLFEALSEPLGGLTADLLRRRCLNTKAVRRLFFTMGQLATRINTSCDNNNNNNNNSNNNNSTEEGKVDRYQDLAFEIKRIHRSSKVTVIKNQL